MGRATNQQGYTLIMVIGIIATLAILAAGLVTLLGNTQHFTYSDRMRDKSFNVAEAALDNTLSALSAGWPATSGASTSIDLTAFRSNFSTSEFPNRAGAGNITQQPLVYDDLTPIDKNVHWDSNGNGLLYVETQGAVGDGSARIQVEVREQFFHSGFPRGVALYTGANLTSNGGGNNPKIHIYVAPPVGTSVTVDVAGTIDDPSVTQSGIVQQTGASCPALSSVIPQSVIDGIVQEAKLCVPSRYFSGATAAADAAASPASAASPQGGLSGLTVIQPSSPSTTVSIGGTYNSEADPGMLLVLGGSNIDMGGDTTFYGVIYTEGTFNKSHGTPQIYGMVVCAGTIDMRGTADIYYDDNCIANLDNQYLLSVDTVQNTWRQIKPQ